MKRATIYCRVSTEDQDKEGTSLQTQLEACLEYCQDKGYDTGYRFSEAYSGLTVGETKAK
jgi:site-specific DNA recombinase